MNKNKKDIFDRKPSRLNNERVLIDLDGVIRDFVGSLTRVYKTHYPDDEVLPIVSRRLEEFFPIGDKIYQFVKEGLINQIMEEADPYPGAIEALNKWNDRFEIVIVTSQPDFSRDSTYIWVGKHKIPTNEVHITYYKSDIKGFALLDDFVDNLQEFQETGRLAVCLDQPWNQSWKGPRVQSVEEFFNYINNSKAKDKLK